MYKQQSSMPVANKLICPECKGTRFRINASRVVCTNCDWSHKNVTSKYGAKRTEFNGKIYDSKFEATTAQSLELRKVAKDIKDYETQYKVEIPIYDRDGDILHTVKHKVDFRVLHNDNSYELIESKGMELDDWKWRKKLLVLIWLPEHTDHIYTVVKQANNYRRR